MRILIYKTAVIKIPQDQARISAAELFGSSFSHIIIRSLS